MDADNAVAEVTAVSPDKAIIVAPDDFVVFFRNSYRKLVVYALHAGADHHDADDIVQDSLKELLLAWDDVHEPLAWARRAVRTNLINLREREHRQLIRQNKYLAATFERCADEPLECGIEGVHELLTLLTPSQRIVVHHLLDDLTPKEVALLLGRSYEAIRRTLSDIRSRLAPARTDRFHRGAHPSPADSTAVGKEDQ
ncbi:RNA polymerase sigma factor [Actinoplanes sp. DH11]|uniref:RNA polymerase sigma factor n=1 Tax=Actinoplanes sp. DH11 TaxID=2857011 RepID=UPI001E2EDAE7|nr:sigma-70 family RNA polymerase sigma factor [Actinoplanes sp. DH11]